MAHTLVEQADIRWRRYRPRHRLFHNPLGFMPLVNLALLIMLFALLHASFVRHPSLAVQLPNSAFLDGTPYGIMAVTLTQEGLVSFRGKDVSENAREEIRRILEADNSYVSTDKVSWSLEDLFLKVVRERTAAVGGKAESGMGSISIRTVGASGQAASQETGK